MKKYIILLISFYLSAMLFAQDTIPNGSFENWSVVDSNEIPDKWQVGFGITKESPGYQSDYSIRLTVDTTYFENIASTASSGFSIFGIPYKLSGFIKSNVSFYDTVYIYLIGYSNSVRLFSEKWYCDSTIDDYTPFEIIVDSTGKTETDSVLIYLKSGCCDDLGASGNGTSLVVDELKLEFYPDEVDNINTSKKSEVIIFPNPANNKIYLKKDNAVIANAIILTDTNGKHLKTYPPDSTEINISTLASGIYILKIETDQGILTEKIIKE